MIVKEKPSGADEWAEFLDFWQGSNKYIAVKIAESIEEAESKACERAIDRMGWDEINAFNAEFHTGQSVYEDAGGYFLRALGRLFGVKPCNEVVSYQNAARAILKTANEKIHKNES